MVKPTRIAAVLGLVVGLRLLFLFSWHDVWWDSAVYMGMGKFLLSGGKVGLWEHLRPPLVPLFLGLFWKLGLDPVLFGRLMEIVFVGGISYLTFLIGRDLFGEEEGLVSALVVGLSPIFFQLSFQQYTEIPSVFFVLLAVFLFLRERYFFAGIASGFAFLARFPAALVVVVLGLVIVSQKRWKQSFSIAGGFLVMLIPYLGLSWWVYGSLWETLRSGKESVGLVLGCNVLRYHLWYEYFIWTFWAETPLNVLSIVGVYGLVKKWNKKYSVVVLGALVPFVYFAQLHCREHRYGTSFLPFVALLSGVGVVLLVRRLGVNDFKPVYIGLLAVLFFGLFSFYAANEVQYPSAVETEYDHFLAFNAPKGEVWSANPIPIAYAEVLMEKVYYPFYNSSRAIEVLRELSTNNHVGTVLLDNCGGGIICPPGDDPCPGKTEEIVRLLDGKLKRVFDKEAGRCWYRVWSTSVS